ncbi:PLP-dependent aminotransferase family protein [bacterium]|nr:MAG: PLP-dependent aminotransferase family protein [bacterium]
METATLGHVNRFATRTQRLRASTIREILKVTQQPDIISFAGGLPAPELFPRAELTQAATRVLADPVEGPNSLQYSVTEGHPPLRAWVAKRLHEVWGAEVSPDDVLVTGGSQQGLDLVAKVFLDPGDTVVLENPSYLGAIQALDAYQAEYLTVETDAAGMVPEALERALRTAAAPPKLVYLVPNFGNPTGVTLAQERREAIVRICERYDVPLVEDDPYGELRYEGNHLTPLIAYPTTGTIIYLGTNSKICAPGLRVAWMVCRDASVRERIVPAKQAADLHTNTFCQYLFFEYARDGAAFTAHVEQIKACYRERRDAMREALRAFMPADVRFNEPNGGLFFWATVERAGFDTETLLHEVAEKQRVAFVPGHAFFPQRNVTNAMRLNFSNMPPARIREGIQRLAAGLCAKIP